MSSSPVLPRVALVYDRVNTKYGGAEQVLLALHTIYPDAPLYTAVYDSDQANWSKPFKVIPSFLNSWVGAARLHRWLAPLMPLAFESFDLSEFEIIISITSAEAKGVLTKPNQLHVCYLLTPTRYLYSHQAEYLGSLSDFPGVKTLASWWLKYLAWWDRAAALRPDTYITISQLIAERCQMYYQQQPATVIYPPVETKTATTPVKPSAELPNTFHLIISRLVEYKAIEVAIQACGELNHSLVIVGDGPERQKLQALAANYSNTSIIFLGQTTSHEVEYLYQHAQTLLMPGQEDFGITALESMAHGVPPIVHCQSGVAELITDQKTGFLIEKSDVEHLKKALNQRAETNLDHNKLQQNARKYDTTVFCNLFRATIEKLYAEHQQKPISNRKQKLA